MIGRNALANVAGRVWIAALGIVFPPVYVRAMGVEGYGLAGFYTSLFGAIQLLDFGIGAILATKLAAAAKDILGNRKDISILIRTGEALFWGLGLAAGAACFFAAPLIATRWLRAISLSHDTILSCVRLMGLMVALQFPQGMYANVLITAERQPLLNAIQATAATVRSLGTLVALLAVGGSPRVFLASQLVVTLVTTLVLALSVRRVARVRFRDGEVDFSIFRGTGTFATGLAVVSLGLVVVNQGDRLLVGRLLDLEQLGYYTLAATVGSLISMVSGSVFTATFPRLCREAQTPTALTRTYVLTFEVTTAIVAAGAVTVSTYASPLLFAWTGNPLIATIGSPVLMFYVAGVAMNGVASVPYALQLAKGNIRPSAIAAALRIVLFVPALAVGVRVGGLAGVAAAWMLLQLIAFPAVVVPSEGRLLGLPAWGWLRRCVLPSVMAFGAATAMKWAHSPPPTRAVLFDLAVAGCLALAAALSVLPEARQLVASVARARLASVTRHGR